MAAVELGRAGAWRLLGDALRVGVAIDRSTAPLTLPLCPHEALLLSIDGLKFVASAKQPFAL